MPKLPVDYSKTVMYKIVSKDLNIKEVYVGHTTDFIKRKYSHKSLTENKNSRKYTYKLYNFIRQNGGWDNFEMLEIEKYSCNDSNEARTRERYWFELLNAKINSRYPQRASIEEKYICCCGTVVGVKHTNRHCRSLKHKRFISCISNDV
jgi:hypothetical protein